MMASLIAARDAELGQDARLVALALRAADGGQQRIAARLGVLAAFCRAHASRVKARLDGSEYRGALLPVPECGEPGADAPRALRAEAAVADALAVRYEAAAERARELGDLSTAWVCDLNKTECRDTARELKTYSSEWAGGCHAA